MMEVMPSVDPSESLRERTRRSVRSELVDAAQELFAAHGYESVTVDQIAEATGMSRRSFFRYFASKDAVVLGKYERLGEQFSEALRARPADEAPWPALRRMFDGVVAYVTDPALAERASEMDRIISASPALRAGYLERMQQAQALVVSALQERAPELGPTASAALVAAAFATVAAANDRARETGAPLAAVLDEAMAAVSATT